MGDQFRKRVKSFSWRFGAYLVVSALNFLVVNLSGFGLPHQWIVLIAFVVGEITKYLNKKYQLKKTEIEKEVEEIVGRVDNGEE